MTKSWVGAWEWRTDELNGRPSMTEKFFCFVFAPRDRPSARATPTARQSMMFALFRKSAR